MKKEVIICDECGDAIFEEGHWVINVWGVDSENKSIDLCLWCAENMLGESIKGEEFHKINRITMGLCQPQEGK